MDRPQLVPRGKAFFHLAQFEAAVRDCHQALEINAYHFQAAAIMGQAYEMQHNLIAALEAYRRAAPQSQYGRDPHAGHPIAAHAEGSIRDAVCVPTSARVGRGSWLAPLAEC